MWQTVWGRQGEHAYGLRLSEQRRWFAGAIAGNIYRQVNLTVRWQSGPIPRLVLNGGLGFLSIVWTNLVQRIAGGVSLYTCCGCQSLYFRRDHKPPDGRNNFCEDCREREGKKISKRLSAARRREREREAKASIVRKKTGQRKK